VTRDRAVRRFYGRWAGPYDAVAVHTPCVGRLRALAADRLALSPGDVVVDLGCGTGANFRALRERVGPAGRVVGVDLTGELLGRARERAAAWENVSVCRADARVPPLAPTAGVDAALATFLVGLLDDPAAAVRRWLELVGAGGRVALLDGVPSERPLAAPLNPLFGAFVWLGSPGRFEGGTSALDALTRRVDAAHGELATRTSGTAERRALVFVSLTAGRL
jgi:ubiquinone/menaquinone biosynthesis C-methylase UbiE